MTTVATTPAVTAPVRSTTPAAPATPSDPLEQAHAALVAVDGADAQTQAAALHTWWQGHRAEAEQAGEPVLPFATLIRVAAPEVFELAFQAHFDAATGRTAEQ